MVWRASQWCQAKAVLEAEAVLQLQQIAPVQLQQSMEGLEELSGRL
jgi:hypothetical protein